MFHICTKCGVIITNSPETHFFCFFSSWSWSASAADCALPRWPAIASIFPRGKICCARGRGGCSDSQCLVGSMRSCSALHTSLVSPICSLALYFTITSHSVAAVSQRITSSLGTQRKGGVRELVRCFVFFFFKSGPTRHDRCCNLTMSSNFPAHKKAQKMGCQ